MRTEAVADDAEELETLPVEAGGLRSDVDTFRLPVAVLALKTLLCSKNCTSSDVKSPSPGGFDDMMKVLLDTNSDSDQVVKE